MEQGTKETRAEATREFYKFLGTNLAPYFVVRQNGRETAFYLPEKKMKVLAYSSKKGEAGLKACWSEFIAALTGRTPSEDDFRWSPFSKYGVLEQETGLILDDVVDDKFYCLGFGNRRKYFQVSDQIQITH